MMDTEFNLFNLLGQPGQDRLRTLRRSDTEAGISLHKRRAWFVEDSSAFTTLTDLDPVLAEIFYQNYRQHTPVLLNTLIGVRNSDKAKESIQRVGSLGEPVPWEGQVHYDDAAPDYLIEWTHGKHTNGFVVEQDLLDDNQYDGIFDTAEDLGQGFNRYIVRKEASVLNNAFTAGDTAGYDAKALCATDHPRSKSDTTSVSNYLGAKALSSTNLEDAIIQLEELGDDRGQETQAMANVLVYGRQNRKKARELVESELSPEDGNDAINVHMDLMGLYVPLLSGKKWFVCDQQMALRMMLWFWRKVPVFDMVDDRGNTNARKFWGETRFDFGWKDWRWVVGSNPS